MESHAVKKTAANAAASAGRLNTDTLKTFIRSINKDYSKTAARVKKIPSPFASLRLRVSFIQAFQDEQRGLAS